MDFLNDLGENRYMKRIKLTVAYDGTAYCGWQVQPNGVTIEEILNREISGLTGEEIRVIGASRTDSGVHALGNVAVFDTKCSIPAERFAYALNRRMPEDIVIVRSEQVPSLRLPYALRLPGSPSPVLVCKNLSPHGSVFRL